MTSAANHQNGTPGEGARTFAPSRSWRVAVALGLAVAFLALDQLTKVMARRAFMTGALPVTVIPGVLEFDFVANTGVSFGLASGFGYAFVALAVVVVCAVAVYLWRSPALSRFEVIGLGMLAGGAVGNAYDRAVFGFVTDFIATVFINFPVFNVADIGITVGVALALIGFMFLSPASKAGEKASQDGNSGAGDAGADTGDAGADACADHGDADEKGGA